MTATRRNQASTKTTRRPAKAESKTTRRTTAKTEKAEAKTTRRTTAKTETTRRDSGEKTMTKVATMFKNDASKAKQVKAVKEGYVVSLGKPTKAKARYMVTKVDSYENARHQYAVVTALCIVGPKAELNTEHRFALYETEVRESKVEIRKAKIEREVFVLDRLRATARKSIVEALGGTVKAPAKEEKEDKKPATTSRRDQDKKPTSKKGTTKPIVTLAVVSSNIEKAAYNLKTEKLNITFTSGSSYVYSDVDLEEFKAFACAKSQGQFFQRYIKDIKPTRKLRK